MSSLVWSQTHAHTQRPGCAGVLLDGRGYLEGHVVAQLWHATAGEVAAVHKELVCLVVPAEHLPVKWSFQHLYKMKSW